MVNDITDLLDKSPIIAALPHTDTEHLIDEIPSPIGVVFMLSGNIINIDLKVRELKSAGKKVFIHIDLIDGLGRDSAAIDYMHQIVKPDGIISTRNNLLKYGKDIGLITVQRLFLIDSRSFHSGINIIKNYEPDFVEVMPGIIPRAIKDLKEKIHQPIIAGGMLSCKNDIIAALKAGAIAVSTSDRALWTL